MEYQYLAGSLNGNGTVQNTTYWGNGTTVLTVAAGSFTGTITDSGITSGGSGTGDTRLGLVKSTTGTLSLSGTLSYGGSTSVESGTLAVVGSLPAASTGHSWKRRYPQPRHVGATGTLNVGITTIAGTLAIDLDATLLDQHVFTGDPDITCAMLAINPLAVPAATPYTIATYSGTLTGSFLSPPSGYRANYGTRSNSTITITKSSSDYNTWGAPYGLALGSEGGDSDGDGVKNQAEYAFGLIPNSGSSVNPITVQLDKTTGNFSYTRRATPVSTGLTYTVWTSETSSPGPWTARPRLRKPSPAPPEKSKPWKSPSPAPSAHPSQTLHPSPRQLKFFPETKNQQPKQNTKTNMKLKNIPLAALTCALLLGSAALSQANVIVSEDFSYADGALNGQNGGTGFSNAWSSRSMSVVVSWEGTILQLEALLVTHSVIPEHSGCPSTGDTILHQQKTVHMADSRFMRGEVKGSSSATPGQQQAMMYGA